MVACVLAKREPPRCQLPLWPSNTMMKRLVKLSQVNLLFIFPGIIFDPSFTISNTRHILHITNTDDENDENDENDDSEDVEQPRRQPTNDHDSEEINEDDFAQDEDDDCEDDGIQHLNASQVGIMLQREVKNH